MKDSKTKSEESTRLAYTGLRHSSCHTYLDTAFAFDLVMTTRLKNRVRRQERRSQDAFPNLVFDKAGHFQFLCSKPMTTNPLAHSLAVI